MKTDLEVRISETDAAGHVFYANYLDYFDIGRQAFLKSKGVLPKERLERGIIMPVVESFCQYKSPALFGDVLTIETILEEAEGRHLKFSFIISCGERLVAKGYTIHVFTIQGKTTPIPEDTLKMLKS